MFNFVSNSIEFKFCQGKNELQTSKEIEEIITTARDQGRKLLVTTEEKADFEYFCSLQDLDRYVDFDDKVGWTLRNIITSSYARL